MTQRSLLVDDGQRKFLCATCKNQKKKKKVCFTESEIRIIRPLSIKVFHKTQFKPNLSIKTLLEILNLTVILSTSQIIQCTLKSKQYNTITALSAICFTHIRSESWIKSLLLIPFRNHSLTFKLKKYGMLP